MTTPRLEDAEALCLLWDHTEFLAREARRLADAAGRLTHTTRRFAQTVCNGSPDDPRHLLGELGALYELCLSLERTRSGIEEAMDALGFRFVPGEVQTPELVAVANAGLRMRVAAWGGKLVAPGAPGGQDS